jgi:hypothetical protein
MGRQTGSFNKFGKISNDPEGGDEVTQTFEELHAGDGPETEQPDPLDHDNDGKKGGSKKGKASTRAKGAAKDEAEKASAATPPEADSPEAVTETEQTPEQPEETPVVSEDTETNAE